MSGIFLRSRFFPSSAPGHLDLSIRPDDNNHIPGLPGRSNRSWKVDEENDNMGDESG